MNDTLVEVDPTEHGFLIEALEAAIKPGVAESDQAAALAQNLRACIAGVASLLPGQVGHSIRA